MKRSYFLVQTLEDAQQLQSILVKKNIAKEQIHMLCADDRRLAAMGLNPLPLTQRKDIFADIEYGGLLGILVGLLVAIALIPFQAEIIKLTTLVFSSIVFSIGLAGIILGGLIGLTRENYHISEFREQIFADQCVVMIDTQKSGESQVNELLSNSGVRIKYLKEEDDELHLEEASEGVPMA